MKEAGLTSPDYVAGTLVVLFDGAIATTVVDGDPNATRYARLRRRADHRRPPAVRLVVLPIPRLPPSPKEGAFLYVLGLTPHPALRASPLSLRKFNSQA